MQKITAQICINTNDLTYETARGYKARAWGADMLLTKHLGYWQLYDIDSRMVIVATAKTRIEALHRVFVMQEKISKETYTRSCNYWKHRQGRMQESEQSISFSINNQRIASL